MIDDTKRFSMKVIELYTYFYFLNKDKNYNKNCINSSPSFQMHYKENLYIYFDCKSKHIIWLCVCKVGCLCQVALVRWESYVRWSKVHIYLYTGNWEGPFTNYVSSKWIRGASMWWFSEKGTISYILTSKNCTIFPASESSIWSSLNHDDVKTTLSNFKMIKWGDN